MIGTRNVRENGCGMDALCKGSANEKIIYAPPDIPSTGVREVAPPCVIAFAASKHTERVLKSRREDPVDPFAFLLRESVLADVRLWVREILLGVGDIKVAAKNNRLFLFEFDKI